MEDRQPEFSSFQADALYRP